LWVRVSIRARCTTLCNKICKWLAAGLRFSPGHPVSSTNKTDRNDITEILFWLKSLAYLEFDDSGQLSAEIYDKRDFNSKIITFPNMCSNIPASPAYGVYISQLIRYAGASSNYSDFLKRHLYLRNRLLDQGYKTNRLFRSLKQFIFRYQDLVEIYSVSAETIINDEFSFCENDKDKEVNKNVKNINFLLSMCDSGLLMEMCHPPHCIWYCFDNCFIYFVPVLLYILL
jgi:hypothetical protein